MRSIIFFLIITAGATGFSFYNQNKFVPPGTVQITPAMYCDKNEVTCFSWYEYQHWTQNMYGKSSEQYKATMIDTSNWDKHSLQIAWHNAKPLTIEMRRLPVVGISYEQAIAFCKWRTERVKYFLSLRKKKTNIDFEYRLPTENEWEFVSNGSSGVFQTEGAANMKWKDNQSGKLLPTESFKPNLHGVYDLTGNAAEMLLEPHIAKGGSWRDSPEECRNGQRQTYQNAAPWLGFRCVCEIKNHK